MTEKNNRSAALRGLYSVCAMVMVVSIFYMLVAGVQLIAVAAVACSLAGVAVPVAMAAEGVVDAVAGILEALVDGIVAILEWIGNIISDFFG